MTTPTLTDEQIIAIRKAQVGRYSACDVTKPYSDSIAFARAILAALPTGGAGEVPAEDHDLDPQMALAYGRRMKTYCEAFDDRDWTSVSLFGSVDEKNLATALDNLTECAAMLMNMAGRVASPASSTGGVGSAHPQNRAAQVWMDPARRRADLEATPSPAGVGDADVVNPSAEFVTECQWKAGLWFCPALGCDSESCLAKRNDDVKGSYRG